MDSIFSTNASRCKVSKVRIEFYQKEDLNGNRFQDSEKNQLIFIVTISTFSLLSAIHFFKDVEVTSAIKVSAYNSALITPTPQNLVDKYTIANTKEEEHPICPI